MDGGKTWQAPISDALTSVYNKRSDLQQLYNADGSAKNPNDPRVAGIPTLNDWSSKFGVNEEEGLGAAPKTAAPDPNAPDPNRPPADTGTTGTTGAPDYSGILKNIEAASQPTADETKLQQQIDALDASYKSGINATEDQQVPMHFITGEEASMNRTYNTDKQTLTQQLATLQAKRQAQLGAYQSEMSAQKPTEIPIGGTLVNPVTGATVATGQSYADKQATASVLSLSKTYPDAGILPTDDPATAAAKASNSASFQIKNSGQRVYVDPMTGQVIYYNTKGPGVAADAGFATTPVPTTGSTGSAGSGMTFTMSSDGHTVLANGRGVDLAEFKQLTGQTGVADNKVNFSMVKKTGSAPSTPSTASPSTSTGNNGFNPKPLLTPVARTDGQKLLNGQSPDDIPETYGRRSNAIAAAQAQDPSYDPTIARANMAAIKDLTGQQANIKRAIAAADSNFQVLMDAASHANNSSTPLVNQLRNDIKLKTGDGALNAFNAALQTVRTEYATVLARGGQVTDSLRNESAQLIPGNINKDQLQQVFNVIKQEGQNVANSYNDQIKSLTHSNNSSGTSGSSGSSNNPLNLDLPGLKAEGPVSMAPNSGAVSSASLASAHPKQVGLINGYDINSYATDPKHEKAVRSIYQSIPPMTTASRTGIDTYIQQYGKGSQIKGQDVLDAAKQYGVDPNLMIALMRQDSQFGTKGKAVGTRNPGNVGNTTEGGTQRFKTWRDGVFAVAQNLSKRKTSAKAA